MKTTDDVTVSQDGNKSEFAEAVRLRNEGKFSDALDILERLLPKYPEKPALLAMAARLYWKSGNLEKAVGLFRSAIRICPQSEIISLGLFHCLWEMNRQEEALDEIRRFMSVSNSEEYKKIICDINKTASID